MIGIKIRRMIGRIRRGRGHEVGIGIGHAVETSMIEEINTKKIRHHIIMDFRSLITIESKIEANLQNVQDPHPHNHGALTKNIEKNTNPNIADLVPHNDTEKMNRGKGSFIQILIAIRNIRNKKLSHRRRKSI